MDSNAPSDQFYILATSAHGGLSAPVLKHADTFAVFDDQGDITSRGPAEQGLFHEGTRHLSRLQLRLGKQRLLLLSSAATDQSEQFSADLTNPDVVEGGVVVLARNAVHVERARFLWRGACHEQLRLTSYGEEPLTLPLQIDFASDFADIFEVRGTPRARRGDALPPVPDGARVDLRYRGLDGVVRTTRLEWSRAPDKLTGSSAHFDITLGPHESTAVELRITCGAEAPEDRPRASSLRPARAPALPAAFVASGSTPSARGLTYDGGLREVIAAQADAAQDYCQLETSNQDLDAWIERSVIDIRMMCTEMRSGPFPYAGVPWYNTTFGRDGIITALETLLVNPRIARGVLGYLAETQATGTDPEADAEPGKILHEARGGEMAALGEVPFGRYYGTVDATPLFVILAGAHYRRTADLDFVRALWPNVKRALAWIDTHGDPDGDGFVEYEKRSATGLSQQGWKDSQDSVFHADGTLAEPPTALCEVQAYVYEARRAAARLAGALGDLDLAAKLDARADELRERFEAAFWSDDLGMYGLALDGEKRLCRVRTSNAGQCLFGGIASPERARRVATALMGERLFSGWGVRTLAAGEPRYNPMSYHNGSVWPHDNALITAGFARYDLTSMAVRTFTALFAASRFMSLRRLPELFCGFDRRGGVGPTLYPVACSPQSWAAGSVFLLLQACLGLAIDAPQSSVTLRNPLLPERVDEVTLRRLKVGPAGTLDLSCRRHAGDVAVTVLRRDPGIEVIVIK